MVMQNIVKQMMTLQSHIPITYIYQIRQVMDVILEHWGISGFQSQQVLVPGFDGL